MHGKDPSQNAQNARTYRAGVAKRLDAIEAGMHALLKAALTSGVYLPPEIERAVREALAMQDARR
jgi:hypothetical protein